MRGIRLPCWACNESGQATAAPPSSVMNSRRFLIGFLPSNSIGLRPARSRASYRMAGGQVRTLVQRGIFDPPTSGSGQKRRFHQWNGTSAAPPTSDIHRRVRHVSAAPDDRRECAVELAFAANWGDDELLPERLRGQFSVPTLDAGFKRVGPNQHRHGRSARDELAQHSSATNAYSAAIRKAPVGLTDALISLE